MTHMTASHNAYRRVDVETASQGKLIVMLLNGAIQRAEEAKRLILKKNASEAHANLLRAQDIIAELRGALNMAAGEVAVNLDRTYEYFYHLLVMANVRKDTEPIDQCVELMTGIRDTWAELFDRIARETPTTEAPAINRHGAALMNLKG